MTDREIKRLKEFQELAVFCGGCLHSLLTKFKSQIEEDEYLFCRDMVLKFAKSELPVIDIINKYSTYDNEDNDDAEDTSGFDNY